MVFLFLPSLKPRHIEYYPYHKERDKERGAAVGDEDERDAGEWEKADERCNIEKWLRDDQRHDADY